MSAENDFTDKYRFEDEKSAIDYAEKQQQPGVVIKLQDPQYFDKPFMFVAYSWIRQAKDKK